MPLTILKYGDPSAGWEIAAYRRPARGARRGNGQNRWAGLAPLTDLSPRVLSLVNAVYAPENNDSGGRDRLRTVLPLV